MEYTKVKLGDILTSISETISKEQQTAIFLNTSDISEGKFLHKRSSVVKELPGQAKKKIKNGDILFSEIRPKNKRYAVVDVSNPNDYVVSTKLMVLRIKDPSKYYLQYIYQQLISQKMLHQINEIAESRSGTFPQITFDAIKNIELTPPPLEEQKRIADIFTVLDDKIELNNQMNQTLEEIASLLYKRWFVDFEFPDDKGNPYKSSGGEMVDSELGMIPKGWEVKELGEIIKFIKGKKPNKIKENKVVGYERYMTIKGITNTEILYADPENTIKIGHNDVSMVMDGASSGDIYTNIEGVLSSTFSKIETEVPNSYIFQVLNYYESDIKKNLTGSAIPHTDKGYINRLLIVVPKNLLLEKLSKKFAFFIQYINGNIKESNVLSEQKKIILKILI